MHISDGNNRCLMPMFCYWKELKGMLWFTGVFNVSVCLSDDRICVDIIMCWVKYCLSRWDFQMDTDVSELDLLLLWTVFKALGGNPSASQVWEVGETGKDKHGADKPRIITTAHPESSSWQLDLGMSEGITSVTQPPMHLIIISSFWKMGWFSDQHVHLGLLNILVKTCDTYQSSG